MGTNSALERVRQYHERSKHFPTAYAPGPEQPDWESQPLPYRTFAGTVSVALPLSARHFELPWPSIWSERERASLSRESLGAFFQLSFALSVWKRSGRQRWALRINPSSGNLHPTEVYAFITGVDGLQDGLYHYQPYRHALELRAAFSSGQREPAFAVAFSSLLWREAWKYGERAFRYTQLDLGHAAGSAAFAASVLGWKAGEERVSGEKLGRRLGLDRRDDFPQGENELFEREIPELCFQIDVTGKVMPHGELSGAALESELAEAAWSGRAGSICPGPGRYWEAAHEAAEITVFSEVGKGSAGAASEKMVPPLPPEEPGFGAVQLILQRRSAQRFDAERSRMPRRLFYRFLDRIMPRAIPPWPIGWGIPRVHPALMVLRVEGLCSGLYFLPRRAGVAGPAGEGAVFERDLLCPRHLDLRLLRAIEEKELSRLARNISCRQEIAGDGAFSLAMLGELDGVLAGQGPGGYRKLFHEAGFLGQVMYLEAEAAGFRGTGIGCFFDDAVRELFGLRGTSLQSIYHFAVGFPRSDERVESGEAYGERVS